MINITLPDGSVRSYEAGVTAMDVAKSISEGLARKIISASVNGETWDTSRPIKQDASLKLLTFDDTEGKKTFWHSSAHLMAEALEALYPGTKFGIGPAIENGFYYDVDFGDKVLSSEEFTAIENKMLELARTNSAYIRTEVSKADALKYFTDKDDPYKIELIQDLHDGQINF